MRNLIFLMIIALASCQVHRQPEILLDNYYNNEYDAKTGKPSHYLWDDHTAGGFSELGKLFTDRGCVLSLLKEKPDRRNLKTARVYIIADPDTEKETASPRYMDPEAATAIAEWVRKGGTLLILTNDAENSELDSINTLMAFFGMRFNKEILHPELSERGKPRNFNSCASSDLPGHPLFKNVNKIFIKGITSISCEEPVKPILEEEGKILMAEASAGKGKVMAVGDPWLYNEYIGHMYLPADFNNEQAAMNLVEWLMKK